MLEADIAADFDAILADDGVNFVLTRQSGEAVEFAATVSPIELSAGDVDSFDDGEFYVLTTNASEFEGVLPNAQDKVTDSDSEYSVLREPKKRTGKSKIKIYVQKTS